MQTAWDKKWIMEMITAGEWVELCRHLRSWYEWNCPQYRRDEVELSIASRVSRWVIVASQIERNVQAGTWMGDSFTEEDAAKEWEIELNGLDGEFAIYTRK